MNNTCCFLGHRKIETTNELSEGLYNAIEKLIVDEKVDTFLFGSNSQFNDLCHKIVSQFKAEYPHIKRIYVRAKFPNIDDEYKNYLLQSYEETYYPDIVLKAGKLAYIKRNYEMINKSRFCVMYYDENYLPSKEKKNNMDLTDYNPKSGTKTGYEYAIKKQRIVINMFNRNEHY